MTMPHLMNCPHQGEGWCLECVKTEFLFTYCAYCGHKCPVDADGSDVAKHIDTCPKHPIAVYKEKLAAASAVIKSLITALELCEQFLVDGGDPFSGDDWQLVQDIRAVIAKAKGVRDATY